MEHVKTFSEEYKLRVLLARGHSHHTFGIPYNGMYMDDGELQCPYCSCDFMRDSAEVMQNKMHNFNLRMLKENGKSSTGPISKT